MRSWLFAGPRLTGFQCLGVSAHCLNGFHVAGIEVVQNGLVAGIPDLVEGSSTHSGVHLMRPSSSGSIRRCHEQGGLACGFATIAVWPRDSRVKPSKAGAPVRLLRFSAEKTLVADMVRKRGRGKRFPDHSIVNCAVQWLENP